MVEIKVSQLFEVIDMGVSHEGIFVIDSSEMLHFLNVTFTFPHPKQKQSMLASYM